MVQGAFISSTAPDVHASIDDISGVEVAIGWRFTLEKKIDSIQI